MEIKKNDKDITIKIYNKKIKDKDYDFSDKWYIFVENLGSDSKDINISYDLIDFFKESRRVLLEESHQMTMDEYLEIKEYEEKVLKK